MRIWNLKRHSTPGRTHRIRRSPSAFGEEGFVPISFRRYTDSISSVERVWMRSKVRTESKERSALYTPSILLNMRSRSWGGRFERDHAEAAFCVNHEHWRERRPP